MLGENTKRCAWVTNDEVYVAYHDNEWGKPKYDDSILFEMLILEGMQAGLSWITVLKKRDAFREALDGFDIDKILLWEDSKIDDLMQNPKIIRNRLKLKSVIENAKRFRQIQEEYGSFSKFIWGYVDNTPIINSWQTIEEAPTKTDLSDRISKDLKKRGFKFVGSVIIYSYMQAVGIVNDHTTDCICY